MTRLPPLAAALSAALALGACSAAVPHTTGAVAVYQSLAAPATRVDGAAAADMLAAYRRQSGLNPLVADPDLQRLAEVEVARMAAAERTGQADAVKFAATRAGFSEPGANLSAGYHTLAEAFSGWRDSPEHRAVMLDPGAVRFGIATAYAPGSKYKVYWAMLTAR
jgi:uncharacterized protein YkwD